jgi:hypothetical protein
MTTKLRNGMEYRWNESSAFQINQTVYLQTISIQEHKVITRDEWQLQKEIKEYLCDFMARNIMSIKWVSFQPILFIQKPG